jgi:hypothetical protein
LSGRLAILTTVALLGLFARATAAERNEHESASAHREFVVKLRTYMASMAEDSAVDAERIRHRYTGFRVLTDRNALSDALGLGTLAFVPGDAELFNFRPRLRGFHPIGEKDVLHQRLYVAAHPGALGCLMQVAARVRSAALDVTSLVRHAEYQRTLQRTNPNARTQLATHTLGVAFDISVLNVPLSATQEIGHVLTVMRDSGDLFFIAEQRQFVFHVVPTPERLGFYAAVFHGLTSISPSAAPTGGNHLPRPDPSMALLTTDVHPPAWNKVVAPAGLGGAGLMAALGTLLIRWLNART